ncbi:MAG: hypothetical protein HY717_19765 [Planctomycetes bacterium]|nr:hypothetical protein [Planctomycetota bacterium]
MAGTDGETRHRFIDFTINNPFNLTWTRQRVAYQVEFLQGASPPSLILYDTTVRASIPYQLAGAVVRTGSDVIVRATVHFFAEVLPKSRQTYRLYYGTGQAEAPPFNSPLTCEIEAEVVRISTGKIQARLQKDSFFPHVSSGDDSLFRGFVIGDPRPFWGARTLRDWVLHVATQTFKGLDLGHDEYNLVSVRGISNLCEAYDLMEASGLFSTEELRDIRAALAVLAYRIMDPDWITWQYNAGQQDFDAARYAGMAALGFVLPDHPLSHAWAQHAIDRVLQSDFIWGVPGSGKWAENPGCYYHQTLASQVYVAHQAHVAGRDEVLRSLDFQEFLRWGVLLSTPPTPNDANILAKGIAQGAASSVVRTRLVPGVGDHGGPAGVEVNYNVALIAGDLRAIAPELAEELMGAFLESGGKTLMGSHRPPLERAQTLPGRLLIGALTPEDLSRCRPPRLASQPLAGYGAVLRHGAGTPDESYVLFKCGPGGARFNI